jgi:hypothetical protein
LAVLERFAAVERLADEVLEAFFRVPELDLDVERLAPDEPLLREVEPDEPPDDPALLLGWGMVFSSYVDRKAPTAP